MTGTISQTNLQGGMIRRADTHEYELLPFNWQDCNFKPNDVGHDTRVQFYTEVISGRERAIAVRLQR
jgi:hypothetical protein